jgi:zinc/manganese transport system substrate-binding protein
MAAVAVLAFVAACSGTGPSSGSGGSGGSGGSVLRVVAAEDFWGSIAAQIGGSRASVQSVVTDPNADPHLYPSSTNDSRAISLADVVIVNGAGYDTWATDMIAAGRRSGRRVLNVANALGKKEGVNPHFWYDPAWVALVSDRITATFKAADPNDASYFDQQRTTLDVSLQPYRSRVAEIRQKFTGVKVGATESIFVYMASALGLDLISPPQFMNAVAEGTEPPVAAVVQFEGQVQQKQIRVLVSNVQTATDTTTNIKHMAAAADIPVVGVSETLQPESATFQEWQLSQLLALENALDADALAR